MSKQQRTVFPPKVEELYNRINKNAKLLNNQRVAIRALKKHIPIWQSARDTIFRYPLGDVISVGWKEFIADNQKLLHKLQFENYELNQRQILMKQTLTEWYKETLSKPISNPEAVSELFLRDDIPATPVTSETISEVFNKLPKK